MHPRQGGYPDPFEDIHRQMARMQQEMLGSAFGHGGFPEAFHSGFRPDRVRSRGPADAAWPSRTAEVEEVVDGEGGGAVHSAAEPVVEEPDEEGAAGSEQHTHQDAYRTREQPRHPHTHRRSEPHAQHQAAPPQHGMYGSRAAGPPVDAFGMVDPFAQGSLFGSSSLMNQLMGGFPGMGSMGGLASMGGGGGQGATYSYCSTFTSSTGSDGRTYQTQSSTRRGPGGVMESQNSVRDGRTGTERMAITRGLGDRQRTIERARVHGGEQRQQEHLRGIGQEEVPHFVSEWDQAAAVGFGGRPRVAQQQAMRALPPSRSRREHQDGARYYM